MLESGPIRRLVQPIYDETIRELLPRKIKVYNGVPANTGRLLDTTLNQPDYKRGTIEPLRDYVRRGDQVVIVGGGWGISAVVAAQAGGDVIVYEAAREMVDIVRQTVRLNRLEDAIEVRHNTIGPALDVYGRDIGPSISINELPSCDVLELDCEGAERSILSSLEQRPSVIIVEIHPHQSVSLGSIEAELFERDYRIVSRFEHEDSPNTTLAAVWRRDR